MIALAQAEMAKAAIDAHAKKNRIRPVYPGRIKVGSYAESDIGEKTPLFQQVGMGTVSSTASLDQLRADRDTLQAAYLAKSNYYYSGAPTGAYKSQVAVELHQQQEDLANYNAQINALEAGIARDAAIEAGRVAQAATADANNDAAKKKGSGFFQQAANTAGAIILTPIAATTQALTGDTTLARNLSGKLIDTKTIQDLGTAERVAGAAAAVFVGVPALATALPSAISGAGSTLTAIGGTIANSNIVSSIINTGKAVMNSPSGQWWVAQGSKIVTLNGGTPRIAAELTKITKDAAGNVTSQTISVPNQASTPQEAATMELAAKVHQASLSGMITSAENVLQAGLGGMGTVLVIGLLVGLYEWNRRKR